jgi:uncharacterized membrane protein
VVESYFLDWGNLLLRWVHVITAIAWVGSSFYFVFLDSSLTPPKDPELKKQGVSGELWAVHGGGFYHPVKFAVSPPELPKHLHWFFWESYSTWLSGFALFTLTYLWQAGTYLVDKSLVNWLPEQAVAVALGFLGVFWLLYDTVCRVFGPREKGDAIVGAVVLGLVCVASYLACHWFAGRAAFLLVGAMMATSMSANVFFWIIPGQKTVVKSIREGRPVDPIHGIRGKQRSVHNTYFTLPVLFAMLSNHYSFTYNQPHNWLVLIGMMFAGAAIRQFFVLRHGYLLGKHRHPWPYAAVGVAVILAMIWALRPAPSVVNEAVASVVTLDQVRPVIQSRCLTCHGPTVQMKNLRFDSDAAIESNAAHIYQQVVVSQAMPMNNATGITPPERALLGAWFKSRQVAPDAPLKQPPHQTSNPDVGGPQRPQRPQRPQ